ncbi:MAG: hypothetical protein QXD33_04150 [Nitrososphaerota archaeon]
MTDKPVIETRSLVKIYRAGPVEVPALGDREERRTSALYESCNYA